MDLFYVRFILPHILSFPEATSYRGEENAALLCRGDKALFIWLISLAFDKLTVNMEYFLL